jgi:DNA-binding response OmpR family regulator
VAARLNIAVVEDNQDLREAIVEVLGALGHRVVGLSCAEDLSDGGAQPLMDLLVVDLNLPGEDGVSLARRLRAAQPGLCILMLTARETVRDKVSGYEAGADIYLTKPVSIEELSAAVKSLERRIRASQTSSEPQPVLWVQVAELTAQGPGGSIELSTVEVALLSALARAPEQRLAHWQLLQISTADLQGASLSNLAVKMTRLRKKLMGAGFEGAALQVIRNEGYQLRLQVQLR